MKKNKSFFCHKLTSENMVGAGGSMGNCDTHTNWTKFFKSIANSIKYAEKDYKKHKRTEPIKWEYNKRDKIITSGDLGFVMYTIEEVYTED